jgi:transposase
LEIDNNAAERALRAVAIGRKNYLFMGADSSGQRAASLYSLIGTAKLNGLDTAFYLRTVLATIAEHPITASKNSCPGTSPPRSTPTLPRPLRHTQQVSAKK